MCWSCAWHSLAECGWQFNQLCCAAPQWGSHWQLGPVSELRGETAAGVTDAPSVSNSAGTVAPLRIKWQHLNCHMNQKGAERTLSFALLTEVHVDKLKMRFYQTQMSINYYFQCNSTGGHTWAQAGNKTVSYRKTITNIFKKYQWPHTVCAFCTCLITRLTSIQPWINLEPAIYTLACECPVFHCVWITRLSRVVVSRRGQKVSSEPNLGPQFREGWQTQWLSSPRPRTQRLNGQPKAARWLTHVSQKALLS